MSNNKPLRRGVDGICTRSTCECEREGLGDQCVWLKSSERPPTPVGWSDTDWLKHLEEIRQNEAAYVKGPLPERGWD